MLTEICHFHLFCGAGGGAHGFNLGEARVGHRVGSFRCLGGVDSDAGAVRDFTTLELAALQGFPVFDDDTGALVLDGRATGAWRERIGNAVPPPAAQAIASVMGQAILLAAAGETFVLSSTPVWVRPLVIAASVDVPA